MQAAVFIVLAFTILVAELAMLTVLLLMSSDTYLVLNQTVVSSTDFGQRPSGNALTSERMLLAALEI
jgi:hypothetical protein